MANAPKTKGQPKDHRGSTGSGRRSNPSRMREDVISGDPPTGPPEPARGKPLQDQARASSSPRPENATGSGSTTDLRNEVQVESLVGRSNSPTPTNQPGTREVPLKPKDHVEAAPVPGPASEPHPTLEVLASRIKESNELYLKLGRQIGALFTRRGEVGLGLGNALIDANAQFPGDWESYLAEECGMDARLAQVYMTGAMLVG